MCDILDVLIRQNLIYNTTEGCMAMARPFSTIDAKRIIERHQSIIEKMNSAVSSVERYRAKAKEASDALVAQEVLCR